MTNPDGSEIIRFFNCRQCLNELPEGVSPAEYSDLAVGWTEAGDVQVWCMRHDMDVVTLTPTPKSAPEETAQLH